MFDNLALSAKEIAQSPFSLFIFSITYLGGVLTAFTPCVYPIIPVTIGVMGAQKAGSMFRAFLLSVCFVLGLAAIYSALGFFAASTGKILGEAAQSPYLIGSVALIFLAMGLSLLGLYEIRIPSAFASWIARFGHAGFAGSFALGIVSGVLAAPCSGPVVVGILAYVAQKTNPLAGFFLLFLFSLGLGTPFLVLGTFSTSLRRIPKTGIWTEWVKHICGLALIVSFFIYAKQLLPTPAFYLLLACGLTAMGIAFHLVFPLSAPLRYFHVAGRIALFVAAFGVLISGFSRDISTPPGKAAPNWFTYEEGLAKSKAENKPAMIDFWAEWCVACHELDDQTYSHPEIMKILEDKFISIKVDATDPPANPAVMKLIQKYSITGLPTVLFLTPDGKALDKQTLTGFLPPEEFKELLANVMKEMR